MLSLSAFWLFVFTTNCVFCDRHMKNSCNFCSLGTFEEREVFTVVRDRLTFDSDLFWNKFTELVFVVQIHLHVCHCNDPSSIKFDKFHGPFFQKVTSKPVFLFKKYLKSFCRIFFNRIQKEIFQNFWHCFCKINQRLLKKNTSELFFIRQLLVFVMTL